MTKTVSLPWRVIGLVWLGWFSIMLPWTIINPLLPIIENVYTLSHGQAGWLVSGYHLLYALMQIPAGFISDKYGIKIPLTLSVLGSSITTLFIGFSQNFHQLLVLRCITGFFSGLLYSPISTLIAGNTSEHNRGKAFGLAVTGFPFSSIIIFIMVSLLVDGLSDWRYFFVICSIPGIACATLFTKYVIDPRQSTQSDDHDEVGFLAVFTSVRKSSFFLFVLVYNCILMLLYNVLATFVPIYYVSVRNISVAETSLLFVVSSITMILSGPLAGYLHDKFGFKTPLLFSTFMMMVIVFLMSVVPIGLQTMVMFAVWGVVGQMFGPIVGTLISRISPQHVQGLSLGLGNFIAFLGATLGPILFGYMIDFYGFTILFILTLIAYLVAFLLPLCIEKNQHLPS